MSRKTEKLVYPKELYVSPSAQIPIYVENKNRVENDLVSSKNKPSERRTVPELSH